MKINKAESYMYDDIIRLPHHVSDSHPHMSAAGRATQFSPFAAITGYKAEIKETGRSTENKIEIDENVRAILDEKLHMIRFHLSSHQHGPQISITYFKPDMYKDGGRYITETVIIKSVDEIGRKLRAEDGKEFNIDDILDIDLDSSCRISTWK